MHNHYVCLLPRLIGIVGKTATEIKRRNVSRDNSILDETIMMAAVKSVLAFHNDLNMNPQDIPSKYGDLVVPLDTSLFPSPHKTLTRQKSFRSDIPVIVVSEGNASFEEVNQ